MKTVPNTPLWLCHHITETNHLNLQEQGACLALLTLLWRSPQQRIPNDPGWIRDKLRLTDAELDVVHKLIGALFENSGNWIFHDSIRAGRERAENTSKNRSVSAKYRWYKEKIYTNAYTGNRTENQQKSVSDNSLKNKETFYANASLSKSVSDTPLISNEKSYANASLSKPLARARDIDNIYNIYNIIPIGNNETLLGNSESEGSNNTGHRTQQNRSAYAFCGQVIRLNFQDYGRWSRAYSNLDLLAELQRRDDWLSLQSEQIQKTWFISTSAHLANRNRIVMERQQTSFHGGWAI